MTGDPRSGGGATRAPHPIEAGVQEPRDLAALRRFMDESGRVRQWPVKRKLQLLFLRWMGAHFERDRRYTQREVDEVLQDLHTFGDWVMLRRELVDLRLLDRQADGSAYWRTPERDDAVRLPPAGDPAP